MTEFERIGDGIYRLCVPFDTVYTTVFLLTDGNGSVLLDCATTDTDVERVIVPALNARGVYPKMVVASHQHADHAGGMPALLRAFPHAKAGLLNRTVTYANPTVYLQDGELLLGHFRVLNLKGHADDALALYDLHTKTLLACDCLQQNGVDKFKVYLTDKAAYSRTIQRLRSMDIERVVCSHDYEPCGYCIEGQDNIERLYTVCESVI